MSSTSLRVVLDANVVVSALVFPGGRMSLVRHAWRERLIVPLVSRATATELIRVLAYPKFGLQLDERDELLSDYLPYCGVIDVPDDLAGVPACRDPDDRPYLQLAIAGRARWLVTGDRVLRDAASGAGQQAITPQELLARVLPAS